MPLYEYRCETCGNYLEVLQKLSDPPAENCDDCGGKLERLLSSPAIQFKGKGWYVTDYAGSNGGKSADTSPEKVKKTPSNDKSESDTKTKVSSSE